MTMRKRASMRPTTAPSGRLAAATLPLLTVAVLASSCSLVGGGEDTDTEDGTVVVVSHESFSLDEALVKKFESETGWKLTFNRIADAGALSADLALNADNPRGDVTFGVDNTFASRVVDAGALTAFTGDLPAGAEKYRLAGDDQGLLAPVDVANVCVNVDTAWFEKKGITPPRTFDDLTAAKYRDLTVVPAASTSSPGMAFLLATIAAKGEGWQNYWEDLLGNGAKVVKGWSDAYYTDFTAASENGKRPVVVSYDSSPAFVLDDAGRPTTAALLDTCFQQVEYAGVLEGADNPEGARDFVEFLLGKDVQDSLPEQMYVFPVIDAAVLPEEWAAFAVQPEKPWFVAPEEIDAQRDTWLREWTDLTTR